MLEAQNTTEGGKGEGLGWAFAGISSEELQLFMGIIVVLFKVTGPEVLLQNIFLCKLVFMHVWLYSSVADIYS